MKPSSGFGRDWGFGIAMRGEKEAGEERKKKSVERLPIVQERHGLVS
jgi:hypothetical protein